MHTYSIHAPDVQNAFALRSDNLQQLIHQAKQWEKFPTDAPDSMDVDDDVIEVTPHQNWISLLEERPPQRSFSVSWNKGTSIRSIALIAPGFPLSIRWSGPLKSINAAIRIVHPWPYSIFSWDPYRHDWSNKKALGTKYEQYKQVRAGFSDGFGAHGVMCGFRGKGHNRLVSRRWLDFGPWRTLRDKRTDTTYIQFHDYYADSQTALDQAGPGYQRMGISKTGGFIQTDFVWTYDWKGFYIPEDKQLRVLVTNREVEQREMLEACALRHYQHLGSEKPLERISYIFFDAEAAHRHLHELWLRELECYTFDSEGNQIRLDDTYDPEPIKPQWVIDLEAREAEQGITWFKEGQP